MEPPSLKPKVSLRSKLAVGLILIIVVLFAAVSLYGALTHRQSRLDAKTREFANLAKLLATATSPYIADGSIDRPDILSRVRNTFTTAAQTLEKDGSLAFILYSKPDFTLVEGIALPKNVVLPSGEPTPADAKAALQRVSELRGRLGGSTRIKQVALQNGGEVAAYLTVGFTLAPIEAESQRELLINGAALILTLIVLTVYSSMVLGRLVITPLRRVIDAMRTVQDGDLDGGVEIDRNDEIGVLGNTFNFMLEGLREREHLKDAFNRYVSRQVYEQLQGGEVRLSGEVRSATILFSDIRSFTALSEKLSAEEVVELLNEYFTEMVEIIFKYDGFLNKFIGDAIMAVYNAPLGQNRPELRAVRTAVEMQLALNRLNERRAARGQFAIRVGIGINTGPVVAGNIGHEQRLEYTVIGDAVNLAQRIESQTKVTGASILISEATYEAVREHVRVEALPPVKVKGKREPVNLYAVQGLQRR
ncbi:MAG: adenylate/guanylate cyclase domain-containing protein [Myxococcota bacterium]